VQQHSEHGEFLPTANQTIRLQSPTWQTHDRLSYEIASSNLAGITLLGKTNAARLLDQFAIHYELRQYEVDPENQAE
jgi:hypothetical protein